MDAWTDGQTDRQTDGHGETSIPPYNFIAGGIINLYLATDHLSYVTLSQCSLGRSHKTGLTPP
jgi:hypothetical protein